MGVFTRLVLLPLAPVQGVIWLAEQLERIAADELYGNEALQRELVELQLAYDEGSLDEEEYRAAVDDLLTRLQVASAARSGLAP